MEFLCMKLTGLKGIELHLWPLKILASKFLVQKNFFNQ